MVENNLRIALITHFLVETIKGREIFLSEIRSPKTLCAMQIFTVFTT